MTAAVSDAELAALIADLRITPPAAEPRCTVTELLIAECAHCRPAEPALDGAAARLGPWIAASFRGKCASCGSTVEEFDEIRADGDGGWLGRCCGDIDAKQASGQAPAGLIAPPSSVATRYRVLVTGSRSWDDIPRIEAVLDNLHAVHGDRLVIVHGACPKGADHIADTWCQRKGVTAERHPADWDTHGKSAGHKRNQRMVDTRPDEVIAFNRDNSAGTTGCITAARRAGLSVQSYEYEPPGVGQPAGPPPSTVETVAPAVATLVGPALTGPPPSTVTEMREVLAELDASRPRSQQVRLGPSELGTPCQRQIAMKLAGVVRQPEDKRPPWAPMQGTAMHTLMEEALRFHNAQLGRERWIVEEKLVVDPGLPDVDPITGHGDAFDTDHGCVVDWKYTGVTALREVSRKTIPNEQLVKPEYRVQAHLYGRGHERAGRDVRYVRLVFLARSHDYSDSREWTEEYRPDIAEWAVNRFYETHHLIGPTGLHLAANPELWPAVPAAPGKACDWCPFRRVGGPADATGCPGNTDQKIDNQLRGLIA